MAVVAQHNDGADRWLRSVVSGRPLDGTAIRAGLEAVGVVHEHNFGN